MSASAQRFEEAWQKALVSYLLGVTRQVAVSLQDITFAAEDPARRAAVRLLKTELPCQDGSALHVFVAAGLSDQPLPPIGGERHVFLGVYDRSDASLAELVAGCLHFDLFVTRLGYGHTLPLPDRSELRLAGYESSLILNGTMYGFLPEDSLVIGRLQVEFFSVHPISAGDLDKKKREGVEALLEGWAERRRDFFAIESYRDQ